MVSLQPEKSIPYASHVKKSLPHNRDVVKKPAWKGWGQRFRELSQKNGFSTRHLAELLELHESTVRSWLNGNREINLTDFFQLCAVSNLDPQQVLFDAPDHDFIAISMAWEQADEQGRKLLSIAAAAVKREDERGATQTD